MSYRPYPRLDRALSQFDRHRTGAPNDVEPAVLPASPAVRSIDDYMRQVQRSAHVALQSLGEAHAQSSGDAVMADLVAFLTARLDEDERVAKGLIGAARRLGSEPDFYGTGGPAAEAHWQRFDPARILADVHSKRRLIGNHKADDKSCCKTCAHWTSDWVDGHKVDRLAYEGVRAPCLTLRLLALTYWDHGLYDEGWKP